MINNEKPISMAEALEFVKKDESKETDVLGFIKKFTKLKPEQGKNLREKIRELNLMKVKEENISKIIDLLPEDAEELNKIFIDMSLDEDETKKILDTIKEFK
jgi:DNA-directed RNA polymerase subunit F